MSKFCTNCGATLEDHKKFCTECGTPVPSAAPAAAAPAPTPIPAPVQPVQQPVYQAATATVEPPRTAAGNEDAPPKGSKYAPITTGGFIGIMLLMCIPVVGLILIIVWACGGCRKVTKRNLARASLIMMVIGLVISLILGFAAKALINSALKEAGFDPAVLSSMTESNSKEEGLSALIGGITGQTSEASSFASGNSSSNELDALGGLLNGLAGLSGGTSENSDMQELEELEQILEGLENLTGEEGSTEGLSGLIDNVQDINSAAEAANDGWPKSLRPYPGGTATAIASYRTEISGTSMDEMLSYIDDLRGDGFKFQDFYNFGFSEEDMLAMNGWWATDGNIYLSISYYEGVVTVDHTYELPDLESYFG